MSEQPGKATEDIDVLVCLPVFSESPPSAGATRTKCPSCKRSIWLSLSGKIAVDKGASLICLACQANAMRAAGVGEMAMRITPEIAAEVRAHFTGKRNIVH